MIIAQSDTHNFDADRSMLNSLTQIQRQRRSSRRPTPNIQLYCTCKQSDGVSLSNAAHASKSPQSNTPPWAVAVRDISLSQLAPRVHQFANCHRARPAAARCRTSRVEFNGLTANGR